MHSSHYRFEGAIQSGEPIKPLLFLHDKMDQSAADDDPDGCFSAMPRSIK